MKSRRNRKSIAQQLRELPAAIKNRYGLTVAIYLSVVASLVVGGSFLAAYASLTISEEKQKDTWAIMFLELERHADLLGRKIATFAASRTSAGVEVYRVTQSNLLEKIRSPAKNAVSLEDFGLNKPELVTKHAFLRRSGKNYLAKITKGVDLAELLNEKLVQDADYLVAWPVDFAKWMGSSFPQSNRVYVVTREGQVVFSNFDTLNNNNVLGRPLVQKFIVNPVAQGQFEFEDRLGKPTYGFVQEIPRTNAVIFSEVSVAIAHSGMDKIVGRFAFVLGIALLISLLVIYIPISKVVGTISNLTRHAKMVASGEFGGSDLKAGVGELGVLVSTFNRMRKSLIQRDKTIEDLIDEQKKKVRLEGEIEIARTIQQNLLEHGNVPDLAKVSLSSLYIPADECAGDWYTYFYDEENDEMIMIVADVSGHGTGSSMFTAIIAGLTEQARLAPGAFDVETYVQYVNRVLRKLGKSKWHATMLIARFWPKRQEMELTNCGHSFPSVVYPEGASEKSKTITIPSMVIGVDDHCKTGRKVIPFGQGAQMLMYTDGLEEARGVSGKQFGRKRIHNICLSASDSPKQQIGRLYAEWSAHMGSARADDDMCLLSVKAV